jgi:UDP-N-acetylmuramyl pentapeptide phosphotransferase/UDP-N-acetylglucosamine-1-phosphate transferase
LVTAGGCALVTSVAVVALARRIAERSGRMLDVPNLRSSHKVPRTRVGGIGIVVGAAVGGGLGLVAGAQAPDASFWVVVGGAFLGAGVGLLDDVVHLSAGLRVVLYLGLTTAMAALGLRIESLALPGLPSVELGLPGGLALSALFLFWYANVFNFMDGIDGMAGTTACVTLGACAVVFLASGHEQLAVLALAATAASIGFLLHNFPPALVFMGDVGSIVLGLLAGALSLEAVRCGALSLGAAALLMLPFVFDATFTVLRRVLRRERFWTAHRTHVYQQLCDLGFQHRAVTAVYFVLAALLAGMGLVFDGWANSIQAAVWWGTVAIVLVAAVGVVRAHGRRGGSSGLPRDP